MGRSRVVVAIASTVITVSCGGREPPGGAPPEPGGKVSPEQVPADYVVTPQGYLHPSCVVTLGPGEEIAGRSDDGIDVRAADGTSRRIAPCAHPLLRGDALTISVGRGDSLPAPATRPDPPAAGISVRQSEQHATYGEIDTFATALRSTWKVPSTAPSSSTQIVLWPGVQDPRPTVWVLQPILEWFAGAPWHIKPCYYDVPTRLFTCTPSVNVNPNDTITGTVTGSSCNPTTHACGSWSVGILDVTTDQSPTNTVVNGLGEGAFRIIGADLEIFGVTSCTQLPGGQLPSFATEWRGFDGVWRSSGWDSVQPTPFPSPFCTYDAWTAQSGSLWTLYLGWWNGYAPYALSFDAGDNRRYALPTDWAPGHYKSECDASDWVVGVSADVTTIRAHSALCAYDGNINSKLLNPSFSIALDFSNIDRRRDTSTGDWDPGYYKGECASNEAVTGVAQTTSGQLTRILCTRAYQEVVAGNCTARIFSNQNNQGNNANGPDWAPGYFKGRCDGAGSTAAVKGVSRHTATGRPHAILCCPYAAGG